MWICFDIAIFRRNSYHTVFHLWSKAYCDWELKLIHIHRLKILHHSCCLQTCALITLQWSKVVNVFCSELSVCFFIFCADLSIVYLSRKDFHSGCASCNCCCYLTCYGGGFLRMSHSQDLSSVLNCLAHTSLWQPSYQYTCPCLRWLARCIHDQSLQPAQLFH